MSLRTFGTLVKEHERQRDLAMKELRRYVVLAHEQGIPIARIAREACLSRQTVYTILEEER